MSRDDSRISPIHDLLVGLYRKPNQLIEVEAIGNAGQMTPDDDEASRAPDPDET